MNAFHVGLDHAHHAIAVIDRMLAPGNNRHGRVADFLFGIPEHAVAFALRLHIGRVGHVGGIDRAVKQGLQPVRLRRR